MADTWDVLDMVNVTVAGIFDKPVQPIRWVWVSYIASPRKGVETVGLCVRTSEGVEIQLRRGRPGWQNTVVHELVHAYNPGIGERAAKTLTTQVIARMKGIPVIVGKDVSAKDQAKRLAWERWAKQCLGP